MFYCIFQLKLNWPREAHGSLWVISYHSINPKAFALSVLSFTEVDYNKFILALTKKNSLVNTNSGKAEILIFDIRNFCLRIDP